MNSLILTNRTFTTCLHYCSTSPQLIISVPMNYFRFIFQGNIFLLTTVTFLKSLDLYLFLVFYFNGS
uniref:Uncharacterized protein n=1 Tax=Octopus bimaculoides TaxID=37653 RepID=A0A0L8IFR8_OCTBM